MKTAKTKAAEALAPMLSAFHSVDDCVLQAVWQQHTEGSLDRLLLVFGETSLVVAADKDDDSVDIMSTDTAGIINAEHLDASQLKPWSAFVGKSFGWGWITINQQGFCDGLILSFGGIVPQLILNVVASSIRTSAVVEDG